MQRENRVIFFMLCKLDDNRESVFSIQDMFPITEAYLEL